ncbi:orf3 [Panicum miliaceum]|uniref:Orf3 n=1 Tax=Panicum miliaceum TaxID=4540 RepID=A0A3L6PTF9_PANMI|nr:orf3 [Panicum miliaceum]
MSSWRPSTMTEDRLQDFAEKGLLPPKTEHEEPQPEADEIVSFLAFHERALGYPAHPFLRGLLNKWEVELQHLNPNGLLHIAGFITLCEGFLGIDLHANLFRAFFYGRALSVKGDPELAPVGGFGLQKRARRSGDYPAYTPANSNRGWHEEWFYIRNPVGNPFPSFTGARPMRKDSWTWGRPAAEKERVEILEKTLWKRVAEDGLNGSTKMWEYTGLTDPDQVSKTAVPDDDV